MLLIRNGVKLIYGLLGAAAAIATIYSTWLAAAYSTEKQTETKVVKEMSTKLERAGFNTEKVGTYLKDQGIDEAINELVRAVGVPVDKNAKTPKTEILNIDVGRVYELTPDLISMRILKINKSQSVISVEGSGGSVGIGNYINLKKTGCEIAILSTSATSEEFVDSGIARARIRCK